MNSGDGLSQQRVDGMATNDSVSAAPLVLSAAELIAGRFERPVVGLTTTDAGDLATAYRKALAGVDENSPEHRAWMFMVSLCDISLQPSDRGSVWVPLYSNGPRRTALPADFVGAQTDALAEVLDQATQPALRARLADIIWSNDRRKGQAAHMAVEAYCRCGEGILDGTMHSLLDERGADLFSVVDIALRALQIAYASSKRGQMPERPKALIAAIVEVVRTEKAYVAYKHAAEHALHFEVLERADVAKWAEELAASATDESYAMALHGLWMFAAELFTALDDKDGRQRALKGALTQTLAMRKEVGSAGAQAHWVMTALQELRHIQGMEELEVELEVELRRLQKSSLKELGSFSYEVDVKSDLEAIETHFADCTLADGLRDFALLDHSRDIAQLRAEALDSQQRAPLASLFSAVHLDDKGRTASRSGGGSIGETPDETWLTHTIERSENIRRTYTVAGRIHPARMILRRRFSLEERHFAAITHCSGFVPPSQAPLFALGFARFFQGDFMSAAHLLIPQLEPALRYVLAQHGHDPSKRFDDATEEDMSLSAMFDRKRTELDAIFGADLASEIDRLFNLRPGPALRHLMAHGQVGAGACFSETVYYANWLIYRVTVLPVLEHWDAMIAPSLD